jgi:hypothetical protein
MNNVYRLIYNSGKNQLTIEKFIRISGHQMATSSSLLAAFLAWTPFDALHQCFLVLIMVCKHLSNDIYFS